MDEGFDAVPDGLNGLVDKAKSSMELIMDEEAAYREYFIRLEALKLVVKSDGEFDAEEIVSTAKVYAAYLRGDEPEEYDDDDEEGEDY